MAFSDFTVTSDGAEWVAQCVEDAQQGTHKAVLDSMDFGYCLTVSMTTLWKSCTDSLRVDSKGGSFTVAGIVDNIGDEQTHLLNRIEVRGHIEGSGDSPLVLMHSTSTVPETIPAEDTQRITRRAVVQIAVGTDASVTINGAVSGYASEDDVVLVAPHHTRGDLILSDTTDSAYVRLSATKKADEAPDLARLTVPNGLRTGTVTASGHLFTSGADETAAPADSSVFGDDVYVQGSFESNGECRFFERTFFYDDAEVEGNVTAQSLEVTGTSTLRTGTFNSLTSTGGFLDAMDVIARQGLRTMRLTNLAAQNWRVTSGDGTVLYEGTTNGTASFLLSLGRNYAFIMARNPSINDSGFTPPTGLNASILFVTAGMDTSTLAGYMSNGLPNYCDGVGFVLGNLG